MCEAGKKYYSEEGLTEGLDSGGGLGNGLDEGLEEADMVSAKLVTQIETHWEAIHARFVRLLRHEPLTAIAQLPESELQEACRRILRNLGHWLVSSSEADIGRMYEQVGRQRLAERIPLSQAIRVVQLMRQATTDYVRDEGVFESSVDLYAEEELEHELARFFDLLVYYLARGYEGAH